MNRQIDTQFYERTALSRNKAAMLMKGEKQRPEDAVSPEEEIKDPFVLEFLGLKDEYSESDLEEALIRHLETFLLELGGDFTFIGRQRRLRIDDGGVFNIGKRNQLTALRSAPPGFYLDGGKLGEILLPGKLVPPSAKIGDKVDVFVYRDSEDRLVATTQKPPIAASPNK